MHKLLFFSRVAFICNCSFLLGFVLRYYAFLPDSGLTSTIIILGFVAPVLNFLIVVIYILMSSRSKKINQDDRDHDTSGSSWSSRSKHPTLIVVNFCFLGFQLISLLV